MIQVMINYYQGPVITNGVVADSAAGDAWATYMIAKKYWPANYVRTDVQYSGNPIVINARQFLYDTNYMVDLAAVGGPAVPVSVVNARNAASTDIISVLGSL